MEINKVSSDSTHYWVYTCAYMYVLHCMCACTQKRRAAQLIRLQRQVSEAQSRRRQFIEESQRLKTAIRDMKKIIEE